MIIGLSNKIDSLRPAQNRLALRMAKPSVIVSSFAINLLALGLPLVILQVYDRIVPYASYETLTLLVAGLGVALILDAFLRMARSYITSWAGMQYEHEVGTLAVKRLLATEQESLDKDPAGVHLDRLASIERLRDFYSGQGALILIDLPFVLIFLTFLGVIGGSVLYVTLILFALFAAAAMLCGHYLRGAIRKRTEMDDRRFSFAIEMLAGMHIIKAHAMEPLMLRRYERLMENTAGAAYNAVNFSTMAQNIGTLFSQLTIAVVVSYGALLILSGEMTMGSLAACTMLAGRSIQPIMRGLGFWAQFQSIRIATDRLNDLFSMPRERNENAEKLTIENARFELKNVGFHYVEGTEIFTDVNLSVAPGECIAIMGNSGSGKTTLLQLLSGMLKPTKGEVLLDGHNIAQAETNNLREKIAYLPQAGTIFQGSIMENLTTFRGEHYSDEAVRLVHELGVDTFIAQLPAGFDTEIGGSSTEVLPGGVRQRLAIIRALASEPKIVLFDEANAMLDRNSDEKLVDVIQSMRDKTTMVIVTHRPSLMRIADRVYEIKNSKLVVKELPTAPPAPPQAAPAEPAAQAEQTAATDADPAGSDIPSPKNSI